MSSGRFRFSTPKLISTSTLQHSRMLLRHWRKRSRSAVPPWLLISAFYSREGHGFSRAEHLVSGTNGTDVVRAVPDHFSKSMSAENSNSPHLKRVLGRWDLGLLFVVAVFNLNVVAAIAANGGVTVWLWIIALLLFFWPQGIAVIELAHRYPGEGGVYLWAKEVFGDFHGFLSGWCYWANNMLDVPTVMLYFVGVSVYVLGPGHQALADNKVFALATSTVLLAVLTWLNIVGLGVGKWINNFGAIGTGVAAAVLIGLGFVQLSR